MPKISKFSILLNFRASHFLQDHGQKSYLVALLHVHLVERRFLGEFRIYDENWNSWSPQCR
jgi:hypothetical protein